LRAAALGDPYAGGVGALAILGETIDRDTFRRTFFFFIFGSVSRIICVDTPYTMILPHFGFFAIIR
jgi:hypothetical protein